MAEEEEAEEQKTRDLAEVEVAEEVLVTSQASPGQRLHEKEEQEKKKPCDSWKEMKRHVTRDVSPVMTSQHIEKEEVAVEEHDGRAWKYSDSEAAEEVASSVDSVV